MNNQPRRNNPRRNNQSRAVNQKLASIKTKLHGKELVVADHPPAYTTRPWCPLTYESESLTVSDNVGITITVENIMTEVRARYGITATSPVSIKVLRALLGDFNWRDTAYAIA